MKTHRLMDGDILKLLPFVGDDGSETFIIDYQFLYLPGCQKTIYDDSDILRKIYFKERFKELGKNQVRMSNKSFINVFINNEVMAVTIGRTLRNLIKDNPDLLDVNKNYFILVRKDFVNSAMGKLPAYDDSHVIYKDWKPPTKKFVKDNQGDYLSFFKYKSVANNREFITKEFGVDLVGEILAEEREKKIDLILEN